MLAGTPLSDLSKVSFDRRVRRQTFVHAQNEWILKKMEMILEHRRTGKPVEDITKDLPTIEHATEDRVDIDSLAPHQKLLEFLFHSACTSKLRRLEDMVYEPVHLSDGTNTCFLPGSR